tara:strand:- start:413 stop:592 length:180 start_codon:yes stop_codon:yes gene_type:complete
VGGVGVVNNSTLVALAIGAWISVLLPLLFGAGNLLASAGFAYGVSFVAVFGFFYNKANK